MLSSINCLCLLVLSLRSILLLYYIDAFDYLDAPVERITGADVPIPYSKPIEDIALVHVENIVNGTLRACYKNKRA